MSGVDIEAVSRTMRELLTREGRDIVYQDQATGQDTIISPASAASPTGLLPAFLVAGEALWRQATGKGFALDIDRDPDAAFGYRLRGIGAGTFTAVMLATMEATAQAARPGVIVVNDLAAVWSAATGRIERDARPAPRSSSGVSP